MRNAKCQLPGFLGGLLPAAILLGLVASVATAAPLQTQPPLYQGIGQVQYRAWIEQGPLHPGEAGALKVQLQIQSGWKVYAIASNPDAGVPMRLNLVPGTGIEAAGAAREPEPHKGFDANFGVDILYHTGEPILTVPFRVKPDAKPGDLEVKAGLDYQACDASKCLIPQSVELRATVQVVAGVADSSAVTSRSVPAGIDRPAPAGPTPGAGSAQKPPQDQGLWAFLALAFGLGILAIGTPCVFPMIPITVSFFTKQAESGGKPLLMAAVYSLGIVFFFTSLGLLLSITLGGTGAVQFAGNPWVNLFIGALFIVFALALFGLFEIQLPNSFVNFFQARSMTGGKAAAGLIGVLFMSLAFSMTSFSCTAPFVGALLVTAAQGKWVWPLVGMVGFSSGLALPFFFLALFPQYLQRMPKSGGWLNAVKVCMGFVVLAATFKFLATADQGFGLGVLTRPLVLAFWVGIFVLMGVYLLGKIRLPHDYDAIEQIGVGRLLFATGSIGLALFFGSGLMGLSLGTTVESLLPPPEYGGVRPLYASARVGEARQSLEWLPGYDEARTRAAQAGKPLLLDFTGHACTNCKAMERGVFPDPKVQALLGRFVLAKLYTDGRDENERRNAKLLIERYGQAAVPYYVIVDPLSEETIVAPRGFTADPEVFAGFLQQGLAGS